jgi:hypothetical protein
MLGIPVGDMIPPDMMEVMKCAWDDLHPSLMRVFPISEIWFAESDEEPAYPEVEVEADLSDL